MTSDRELIMWELPMVDMPFGKYKGKSIKWISTVDRTYLEWLDDEVIDRKSMRLYLAIQYYLYDKIPKAFADLQMEPTPRPKPQPSPQLPKFGNGFRLACD